MTGFEFGDVVLVPFPFTDHSATKQRPAVVVSSGAYHHRRPDLIIMAVTSQLRSAAFGDMPLTHWQAAGLLKPSMLSRSSPPSTSAWCDASWGDFRTLISKRCAAL